MALTAEVTNHFKYLLATGGVDFSSDEFKIILMNDTYTFDKDNDTTLSGVTADQLATANGYTQDSYVLQGVSVSEDDSNDRARITWEDPSWTATSGNIGPTGSSIVYNNTVSGTAVLGCITFDKSYTISSTFVVEDIAFNLN